MWLVLCITLLFFMKCAAQDSCGLGTADVPWLSDNYGRLRFPVYNQDSLDAASSAALKILPTDNSTSPCTHDVTSKIFACTGHLDESLIGNLTDSILSFLVFNYGAANPTTALGAKRVDQSWESDYSYNVDGEIYSKAIGIGIHISANLKSDPDSDSNKWQVDGDAFSNELRIQWRLQGNIAVITNNGLIQLQANVSTIEDDGWQLIGIANTHFLEGGEMPWSIQGTVTADFFKKPLDFSGNISYTNQNSYWDVSGTAIVNPLLILWTVQASVTSNSTQRNITIPSRLFKGHEISNMMFTDSEFIGDFDNDALQGVVGLKTITFINSKLEKIPPFDSLFKNLTEVQALYIEGSSMPNINMGDIPSLPSLELLSLKGSGPLQLSQYSFSWLNESSLKYINLQNCNINIDGSVDQILEPVKNTLRYLDLSFTSLNNEAAISAVLSGLQITHLSLAGLQLSIVPRDALKNVKHTLRFLTLRGNSFRKVPEENMFSVVLDFPKMTVLEELDLKQCAINFIETGVFDNLPALKTLYLAHNNVENVQEGWYDFVPSIVSIDLSCNGAAMEPSPISTFSLEPGDGLTKLEELETVDLSYAVFTYPEDWVKGLSNKTKKLYISYTNLSNKTALEGLNLPELTLLDISGNSAIEFGGPEVIEFFHSLYKLKQLHARDNKITNSIFSAISNYTAFYNLSVFIEPLTMLDLSNNNIKSLKSTSFSFFPNLETVNLNGNSIAAWSISLMLSPLLSVLKISDNKIETITEVMLKDLTGLRQFEMGRNPFQCDCGTQIFANRVKNNALCRENFIPMRSRGVFAMRRPSKRRLKRSLPRTCALITDWENGTEFYCYVAEGEVMKYLKDFNNTDLCVAQTIPAKIVDLNVVYIGIAVIISFALITAFIYWKWWEIRLLTRAVRNAAILSFMESEETEEPPIKYSVFVSYSDKDRMWVLKHLLPQLEQRNDGSVCLHERDFQVGLSILENITYSMERSRNLVLVLSQSFIISQWCQFELHLAQHKFVESRRNRLLLVLLEPIPNYRKPKTLRYLMRTNTYLEWPGESKSAELERFWDRLLRSLAPADTEIISA